MDVTHESHRAYYVYLIESGRRSYIGATVSPRRRLRQHNGQLRGGARRTSVANDWTCRLLITGFRTWREALQFEWAAKYHTRRKRGHANRVQQMFAISERAQWTSRSPPSSEVPLSYFVDPCDAELPHASPDHATPTSGGEDATTPPLDAPVPPRKRRFTKALHGVRY